MGVGFQFPISIRKPLLKCVRGAKHLFNFLSPNTPLCSQHYLLSKNSMPSNYEFLRDSLKPSIGFWFSSGKSPSETSCPLSRVPCSTSSWLQGYHRIWAQWNQAHRHLHPHPVLRGHLQHFSVCVLLTLTLSLSGWSPQLCFLHTCVKLKLMPPHHHSFVEPTACLNALTSHSFHRAWL